MGDAVFGAVKKTFETHQEVWRDGAKSPAGHDIRQGVVLLLTLENARRPSHFLVILIRETLMVLLCMMSARSDWLRRSQWILSDLFRQLHYRGERLIRIEGKVYFQ